MTHQSDHPFEVLVRTLAGHTHQENVKPSEVVSTLTEKAVRYFVARNELSEGQYSLTLPRLSGNTQLDPTASLGSVDVIENDTLVLISRTPQIDG